MLGGLTGSFLFGGTGNHQGKLIIMGGLPTPDETMCEEFWGLQAEKMVNVGPKLVNDS